MILFIMLIIIATTTIIITTMIEIKLIIKCRGRSRASTTNNSMLFVITLYNSRKPLTNITKISKSDVMWVIYAALKQLIHHLTWWIGVHNAAWIRCLELSPLWLLKNTCNGYITVTFECKGHRLDFWCHLSKIMLDNISCNMWEVE